MCAGVERNAFWYQSYLKDNIITVLNIREENPVMLTQSVRTPHLIYIYIYIYIYTHTVCSVFIPACALSGLCPHVRLERWQWS